MYNTVIAILLIFYGFLKVAVLLLNVLLTNKQKEKYTEGNMLSYLITKDETVSGLVFEIVIAIFGVFTIVHGIDVLYGVPKYLHNIFLSSRSLYIVHGILGMVLVVFYSLVVFTKLPIPKTPEFRTQYVIKGICTGLAFLLTIPIIYMYRKYIDSSDFELSDDIRIALFSTTILTLILLYILSKELQGSKGNKMPDLATLAMIPLDLSI